MSQITQTPETQLSDSQCRELSLDSAQSYCVAAPAGSGKTELLTQRFLALLATVDQPEQVLAMTFTRKAAAEMRERVMSALQLGVSVEPPVEPHKKRTYELAKHALESDAKNDWGLLENPARCRIQTIDSVTQSIALDQPITSQFGGGLRAMDDAASLYEAATVSLLGDLLSTESSISHSARSRLSGASVDAQSPGLSDIEWVLSYFDNDISRLQKLFMQMLRVRSQWLPHAASLSDDDVVARLDDVLKCWIEDILAQLRETLSAVEGNVASDLALCADFAGGFFANNTQGKHDETIQSLAGIVELPQPTLEAHRQWMGIAKILLTQKFEFRKSVNIKQGFPAKSDKQLGAQSEAFKERLKAIIETLSSEPEIIELLKSVLMLPVGGYRDEQKSILRPLANCLIRLTAHLNLVFSEKGQCDHIEMAIRALRALDQEQNLVADTRYRWGFQLSHLLVDEFQDTSVAQFSLIEQLVGEWQSWNEQNSDDRKTLFVVGDGMQSIYSFRDAKVGLFLKMQRSGIAGLNVKSLALEQNFRSTPDVVNWVNDHFSGAFPSIADSAVGAVPYAFSHSAQGGGSGTDKGSNEGTAADTVRLIPKPISTFVCVDAEGRDVEANQVVGVVQRTLRLDNNADIAILVRARSHIVDIIKALDDASILWQGVDLDLLVKREVVVDCLSLTRALFNPIDDIAWYAVLRAPWCGLTLVDMHAVSVFIQAKNVSLSMLLGMSSEVLSESYFATLAETVSADGMIRLRSIIDILATTYRTRRRNHLRVWIESTWGALDGMSLAGGADSEGNVAAQSFFAVLEEVDHEARSQGREVSFSDIESRVDKIYAPVRQSDNASCKPVQIMTIHKAKGLEFDTVILPGLDRTPPSSDKPLLMMNQRLFRNGGTGTLLHPIVKPPILASEVKHAPSSVYDYLREQDKRVKDLESTRLLYVAATRAKRQLVLVGNVKCGEDGEIKTPAKSSLLYKLWSSLPPEVEIVYPENIEIDTSVNHDVSPEIIYKPLKRLRTELITQRQFQRPLDVEKSAVDANEQVFSDSLPVQSKSDFEAEFNQHENEHQNSDEQIIGIFVHKLLETVANDGLQFWKVRSAQQLNGYWWQNLSEMGIDQAGKEKALDRVSLAYKNILSSELFSWILDNSHRASRNEWALNRIMPFAEQPSAMDDDQRVVAQGSSEVIDSYMIDRGMIDRSVIDRSFIDSESCRWVIDYKTATPTEWEAVDAFMQRQMTQYRPQLTYYQTLVNTYDSNGEYTISSTKMALYFPLIDELAVLD